MRDALTLVAILAAAIVLCLLGTAAVAYKDDLAAWGGWKRR